MPRRSTRGEEKHTNPETHKSETYPTRAEARGHTPRGHECYCLRSLFPPSPPPPHPTPPHKRKMFVCLNYRAKCLCAPEYQGGEFGPARGRRGPLRGHQKACEKMFVCLNYRAKSLCTNIFKAEFPSQNSETTKNCLCLCAPQKSPVRLRCNPSTHALDGAGEPHQAVAFADARRVCRQDCSGRRRGGARA